MNAFLLPCRDGRVPPPAEKRLSIRIRHWGIVGIAAGLMSARGVAGATDFAGTVAEMTPFITNQMAARGVAGLSIALVESNAIVWAQGFGLAVVESNLPASAQTVYRIGSVSKVFTAAAVLKLWEDGHVDLEAAFTNYIPEFAILPRFPANRTPTVRECLNHQSGLPGDMFRNAFTTAPWDGYNAWLLDELSTDYPNYPTGFRSIYCNTGFQMAEELVGRVAGVSFTDYAQSKFFGPMGMTSTSYLKDKPNIAARLAHAYRSGVPLPEEFVNAHGTGGMYSSVEDMAALIRMILAEGRFGGTSILAAPTVAAMLTDQTTNRALDVDSELRFGLGWDTVSKTQLNYAGRLCFKDGQPFTYYCAVGILRDRQLGVVVMQNSSDSLPTEVAHETLKRAVLERDGLAPPTYTPSVSAGTNWTPGAMAAVTGLYVTVEGMESGIDFLAAAPDGSLTWTLKAHTDAPISATGLVPHVDGWIYSTEQPYMRILPTNLAGRAVLLYRTEEDYGEVQGFRGDLYAPPPIPAAWSNRLNASWLPVDMPTTDLYWTLAKAGRDLRLCMTNRLGLLWMTSPSGNFVISPSNDNLGFAAGSAVRRGASVVITRTNDAEHLRFSSYTYRCADSMPGMTVGTTTNGVLGANAMLWISFQATAGVYYCASVSSNTGDVQLNFMTSDFRASRWTANRAGVTCPADGSYWLLLSATSPTPYNLTLGIGYTYPGTADFSGLDWTNAFEAAHEKFSREYAFTQWKSVDWPDLRSRFLPRIAQALAATNEQAYYQALLEYGCSFPDAHISLTSATSAVPAALGYEMAGGGLGMAVAELDDGRVIAAAVITNGPAGLAGIVAGAEILAWGGQPTTQAIASIQIGTYPLKALTGSLGSIHPQATLEHYQLEQARLLARGPVGTNVQVVFRNPGVETNQSATLTAAADGGQSFSLLNFAQRADFSDQVEYRILPEGYGYVLLRMEHDLSNPGGYPVRILQQFQAAMTLFVTSGVPGVIVDLRGNFGGSDQLAADLCGFFFATPSFYEEQEYYDPRNGQFTRITMDEHGLYPYLDSISITPQTPRYEGPVVALVNPGTISSGEGLAMGISRLPNGRVIGFHGTAGAFGMTGGNIKLPGGYAIEYPFGRSVDQSGVIQLDSRNGMGGIAPDLRVPRTLENVLAYAAGTDVELQYAVNHLQNLPVLQAGQTATGTLAAGESALYQFTIADPIWHNIHVRPTNLLVRAFNPSDPSAPADLSSTGTYSLVLQNISTSSTPFSLRLYTLTGTMARVTALATNLMAANNLVGCGISLVDGGHIVWQTGFGHADRERDIPADENTVFMIGSCTKTFGAIAAMQLAEEGRFDLDAPLTNALPSFSIHQRFPDNAITLRTILTHHSGLPGDIFNHGFTVRPNYGAPDQIEMLLADEYTLLPANTLWSYNNSGFIMLGQALRHVTGIPLADYARTNLFDRMAMTHSSLVRDLPYIESHLARPYLANQVRPDEYVNLFYAGSIYSTASDMARYMRMLLAGGMGDEARVISESSLAEMGTLQNADIPLDRFSSLMNMGIGFLLDPPWLRYMGRVIWHDGSTAYFHTLLRVAIDAQLGCFISCNTSETGGANEEIVDAALRWAYEEKTGIAPPPPCDPGTPASGIAPADVIALATGGVFVTGTGLDRFSTNGTGLLYLAGVQRDAPGELALTYRDNGWFTPAEGYEPQIAFTQTVGRILCLVRTFDNGVTNLSIRGERAAGIHGFDPAWSNRLGRWWATNLHPDDIAWLLPGLLITPMTELYVKDDILLLVPGGWREGSSYVLVATNDALAFAAGLGRNKGSALRADGDSLAFMGVHYRSQAGIPILAPGASTNGTTAGDETFWHSIPAAAGQPFTVDLASDHDITAWLYDTNGSYLGQANRAHAFHLDASHAKPLMVAVVRNGTNVGPWHLTLHTNAVPFHHPLPCSQWPSDLVTGSNIYGSMEFGHVFVPESRTNATGNLLKIAVARMNGPTPAAQPILFCEGGPGDSSIRSVYQHYMRAFTDTYHVYLIDQRGIGYSQPDLTLRPQEVPTALQYRLTMLQDGDLTALNTLESSYDLDDLAAALGLAPANLHGLSYGTLLAQTLMRRNPPWLRAVVLDGVMAPNIPPFSQTGPIRNDALNALFADVAAHPRASVEYPDFPTTFYALSTHLQDHPARIHYSGIDGEMNGQSYLDAVLQQMTVSDIGTRERIPNIVYRAAAGETAALAELYTGFNMNSNALSRSVVSDMMQMLVIRHDILPFDSLEAASNACAGLRPPLRQLNLDFMQQVVNRSTLLDPAGQADPSFTLPVTSAIPTLVINGTYDTQTGTNWAAEVASHLPNAFLVTVPTVGHGVLYGGDRPLQTIRNFLANPWADPTAAGLEDMTVDFSPPWPATPPVLSDGQTVSNSFASAGQGAWYRFAAVSGLCYALQADFSGAGRLRIVATDDASGAEHGGGYWCAPGSGDYLAWLIADTPGLARLAWTYPLLIRDIRRDDRGVVIEWQGRTNTQFFVSVATNLMETRAFVEMSTPLPSAGWITTYTNATPSPALFMSVRESDK